MVVRPHPAENQEPWHAIAAQCNNLHVTNEGNVIPWLIAAKALVHNGCTTAVEAAVLGTPAISYRPVIDDACDFALPNSLSHEAFSLEQLLSEVGAISEGRPCPDNGSARRAILARHIASLEGPLAADRIVSALCDAEIGRASCRERV